MRRSLLLLVIAIALLVAVGIWGAATELVPDIQGGDGKCFYLPIRAFSGAVMRSGSFPLWNPYVFAGFPHLADIQAGVFYPPNIFFYLFLPPAAAFDVSLVFNVFLILFFASRFLRLLVSSPSAIWIGASTFALAGILSNNAVTVTIPNAAAWIPPFFWCLEKWLRTSESRYCWLGSLCLAMQVLAGWPQMVLLTAIYSGIYVLLSLPTSERRLKFIAGYVGMGILSAGLVMAQVLPTLELKAQTILQRLSYPEFSFGSVSPQLLGLIYFPFLLGAGLPGVMHTFHKVPFYGPISHQVNIYYVGILPLMLAMAAVPLWQRSRYIRWGLATCILTLPLMWAGNTPLGRLLYRVPVYNFFHDHRIHLIFFSFSIAILAASGAEAIINLEFTPATRNRLGWVIPAINFTAAALLLIHARALLRSVNPNFGAMPEDWLTHLHQAMRFSNPDMIAPTALLLGCGALFWLWMRKPKERKLRLVAAVVVTLDLLYFGISGQWWTSTVTLGKSEIAALQQMRDTAGGQQFRSLSLSRWFFPEISTNLNTMYQHPDILGIGPFLPRENSALLDSTNTAGLKQFSSIVLNNTALSAMNVRFLELDAAQFQELQRVFGPLPSTGHGTQDPPSTRAASDNLVSDYRWLSEKPAEELGSVMVRSPDGRLFGIIEYPSLRPDTFYEVSFKVRFVHPHDPDDLGIGFQSEKNSEYFSIPSWIFGGSGDYQPYTRVYRTGSDTAGTALKLISRSHAGVKIKDIELREIVSTSFRDLPYRLAGSFNGLYVLENTNATDRAYFATRLVPVTSFSGARAVLWQTIHSVNPSTTVAVEIPSDRIPSRITKGTIQHLKYGFNEAELEVACAEQCFLVLADNNYPGWSAKIDGHLAEIYPTNAVMRGILVPAGNHKVQFAYHSKSLMAGLLVSSFSFLFVVGMLIGSIWQRTPEKARSLSKFGQIYSKKA